MGDPEDFPNRFGLLGNGGRYDSGKRVAQFFNGRTICDAMPLRKIGRLVVAKPYPFGGIFPHQRLEG